MNAYSKAAPWLFSNHKSVDILQKDLSYACTVI